MDHSDTITSKKTSLSWSLIGRGRNAGRGVLCCKGESHYGISCPRIYETKVPCIKALTFPRRIPSNDL